MLNILFHVPLYKYEVNEWDRKKKALLSKLDPKVFSYYQLNDFQSDRHVQKNSYLGEAETAAKCATLAIGNLDTAENGPRQVCWTLRPTSRDDGSIAAPRASPLAN